MLDTKEALEETPMDTKDDSTADVTAVVTARCSREGEEAPVPQVGLRERSHVPGAAARLLATDHVVVTDKHLSA